MNRRQFLCAAAATAIAPLALAADQVSTDIKITRITCFDLTSKRVKFVGKNARLGDHGDSARDRIVILHTNSDHQGIGYCRADEKKVAELLGANPRDLLDKQSNRVNCALGAQTAPVWDLLGKLANKPVYQLLTTTQLDPPQVRVYDGSVYFSDLLDEYTVEWEDRFKWEVDDILRRGHRALKIKIGRGAKWMEREKGDARDIEVVKLIRAHAGKEVAIAVDANNGYDLARTKRLLESDPDLKLDFIEEMFEENIEKDLALKEYLSSHKLRTLIADGETNATVEPLKPFMAAKAIDIYQLDVNQVGIDGLMEEAALASPHGGTIAPHAWGTNIGFYAQLHVGRANCNYYSGEQDPLTSPALITEGYTIKDGRASVPDTPGFGIQLDTRSNLLKPVYDLKV
jgi:L-alanine-DL-glutamate epimerase-like enolase superfamily enzyme